MTGLYAQQMAEQNSASAPSATAPSLEHRTDGLQVVGDRVEVEISADKSGADLLPQLEGLGMRIDGVFGHEVSGMLPIRELPSLAELPGVHYVSPAYAPVNEVGAVTSQGDKAELSDQVRRFLGYDGTGVTIGVISNSFNALGGYAADVASGDLPANIDVIQDDANPVGTPDEGRAMLQIIHDVAPGASLAFAADEGGDAALAENIGKLYLAGAKVIVDDARYDDEPMFQDGIIAQEVNYVAEHGVAYFSSAGNQVENSYASAWNSGPRAADGAIPFNLALPQNLWVILGPHGGDGWICGGMARAFNVEERKLPWQRGLPRQRGVMDAPFGLVIPCRVASQQSPTPFHQARSSIARRELA